MPENHLTVAQGLARLPGPEGERFVELFRHGTLSVELYAPRGTDPQTPHTRDEVYVVVEGSGQFRNGAERHPFEPGDVLFVAGRRRAPVRGVQRRSRRLGVLLRTRGRGGA